MRRKNSAAVDRLIPRELITRATAEHSSPAGTTSSTGRHRAATPSDPVHPTDDIDRDTAGDPEIQVDRTPTRRRLTTRRLAPLGIGAAAVLAVTLVVTLLQPAGSEPALGAARMDTSDTSGPDGNAWSRNGDGGSRSLAGAAGDASDAARTADRDSDKNAEKNSDKNADKASDKNSDRGSSGGDESTDQGSSSGPVAGPLAGAAQVAGDGVQAALALGWGRATGDEFTGSTLSKNWTAYNGAGHNGKGRRTPDAISVENGNLVIRGDAQGNTGGMAWHEDRKYGKWEMRARMPKGDKQYHPVLLLWPQSGDGSNGEVDFAETNSAADDVSFFLHHGGGQKTAKQALDLTQWHNYAVEWTPDGVRGFIDGKQWFESSDSQPSGPVHPTIQLDYFPSGGSPQPSELQVAWMRQYG